MIRVYFADITPLAEPWRFAAVLKRLSTERRRKAEACKTEQARLLSAGAGYLLSYALSLLGIDEATMEYSYNQYGKPSFNRRKSLDFSLSHSGSMAICSLSDCGPVGCDIESPGRRSLPAARRFFHPNEYEHIICSADPGREFLRIWTLKESYIKALGTGLATRLSSFEIVPASPPCLRGDDRYHFAEFLLDNGCFAAVCGTEKALLDPVFVDLGSLKK